MLTYQRSHTPARAARRLALLGLAVLAGLLASAALLLAAAWPALAAPADTRTYPGAAPCNTTLQACINGANPGDTIVVQPGNYTESLTLSKAVSLTGVASNTTILHALPDQRVLTVTGAAVDSSVVISGLTFTGSDLAFGPCQTNCGGGLILTGTAQPWLINLIFTGNRAEIGGGVFANSGSPLRLANAHVIGNQAAQDGGGVYAGDGAVLDGGLFYNNWCHQPNCRGGGLAVYGGLTLTATHVISNGVHEGLGAGVYAEAEVVLLGGLLAENRCESGACQGGGLYVAGDAVLTGTHIIDNFAQFTAAGAYLFGDASLHGVLFQGNQCPAVMTCNGGALRMSGDLLLSASQFVSNHAGRFGGGLYLSSGNAYITNTLFAANRAGFGTGIFLDSPGNVTIVHTTIASPTQVVSAAVRVDNGTVAVYNSLIANHDIGVAGGNLVTEDYNLFANVPSPTMGSVSSGGNSLTGEAGFVNAAGGNYHLGPSSDAIDAASGQGVTVDFDGQPRPLGLGYDIGFDEFAALFMPLLSRSP